MTLDTVIFRHIIDDSGGPVWGFDKNGNNCRNQEGVKTEQEYSRNPLETGLKRNKPDLGIPADSRCRTVKRVIVSRTVTPTQGRLFSSF